MFRNGLQLSHVIVVLIIVVLLFGAKRLPDAAKSIGQSLKIFKNEIKDLKADDTAPVPPAAPAAPPDSSPAAAEPPATRPAPPGPDQVPPSGTAPQA